MSDNEDGARPDSRAAVTSATDRLVEHVQATNQDAQGWLAAVIADAQRDDPLAPVRLVVDSPLTGTVLRRQLIASSLLGPGVANVSIMTLADLVATLAERVDVPTEERLPRLVHEAVVSAELAENPGPFEVSRHHPSTALRLSDEVAALRWCPLSDEAIEQATAGLGATSADVLSFIDRVRARMWSRLGVSADVDAVRSVEQALRQAADLPSVTALGTVVVLIPEVPSAVLSLLGALSRHVPVHLARVVPGHVPQPTSLVDCPDPATEAALAVRRAVAEIDRGVEPENVALLYPSAHPYAALLARELDAAGVAWHGQTTTTLGATALARVVDVVLQMAADRLDGASGITRTLLLKWFNTAPLYDGAERLPTWRWRALIRNEDLYGDATGWAGALRTLADQDDDVADDDDDPEAAGQRRRRRTAADAASLAAFLDRTQALLESVITARDWREMGTRVWDVVDGVHLGSQWWAADPAERQARDRLSTLLLDEVPSLDRLGAETAPSRDPGAARSGARILQQVVARDLGARRGRHGDIGAGVHTGSLSSATLLAFTCVVIVGGADGLLPPLANEDPLVPDDVRTRLRASPADLPTSVEQVESVGRLYAAVASSARRLVVTRPRAVVPGRGTAHVSRFVSGAESQRIGSRWSFLDGQPWPVTEQDWALRERIADPVSVPSDLEPAVDAARAARRRDFDRFHGNVPPDGEQLVWDIRDRHLSASAIESYLHCPHRFFVERVLGMKTDEIVDEVEEVAPKDLGTLLHRALERLVHAARDEGWLPEDGQPWPPLAEQRLRELFDEQVLAAEAKGLTGWRPAWRARYDNVVGTFPELLALDADPVRADPPVAPESPELTFGTDDGPDVPFLLSDGSTVRLRGAIDRVDRSSDGGAVGVVDYKSGKSTYFKKGLGAPKPKGDAPRREKVQDLVYHWAARVLYPDAEKVAVRFVFVPDEGEVTIVASTHDDDPEQTLRGVLDEMQNAGRTGRFPPTPSGAKDFCPVCRRFGRRAEKVAARVDAAVSLEEDDA